MFESATMLWLAIGVSITVVVVARHWSWFHPSTDPVLGTVSDQWLAEHRATRKDIR